MTTLQIMNRFSRFLSCLNFNVQALLHEESQSKRNVSARLFSTSKTTRSICSLPLTTALFSTNSTHILCGSAFSGACKLTAITGWGVLKDSALITIDVF
ncbi:hypothetical protein L596_025884 [Steinernema carpocapsae]|uniref:Uncharacterized protein n=1 Tax=Steinernema carpocapsae TaxID=34508 RepID=A0A4U5M951_STECR|nr:hypothetical protein L596_025884 [Steinernema carpocapsae]